MTESPPAVAVDLFHAVPRRDDLHEVLRAQSENLKRLVARRDRGALQATLT